MENSRKIIILLALIIVLATVAHVVSNDNVGIVAAIIILIIAGVIISTISGLSVSETSKYFPKLFRKKWNTNLAF